MSVLEFCVSYNAVDFEQTSAFYTDVLNFTPSVSWNRADGRGAFFVGEGNGVVEIFAAAKGELPYKAPPPDSFMIVIVVDDVDTYHDFVVGNGAEIRWPIEEYEWGRWFGVLDPNNVGIYFMQRLGENVAIARAALRKAVMVRQENDA
ncbi:MAG: hypothetical protein DRR42_07140 [Gammaproteobacteria bacterium]|nr:MAG: hypothetical protein DRR42_07140 [Gammaproteobacteria bacterium]